MASIYGGAVAIIKGLFNLTGLDVTRASRNPGRTLLGLRHLPIRSVIDVGANSGQFARHIIQFFPRPNQEKFRVHASACPLDFGTLKREL